jgi:hypothetical protein
MDKPEFMEFTYDQSGQSGATVFPLYAVRETNTKACFIKNVLYSRKEKVIYPLL